MLRKTQLYKTVRHFKMSKNSSINIKHLNINKYDNAGGDNI